MEILTTLQELPEKLKHISVPPETRVRVIIEDVKIDKKMMPKKPHFPFLDSNVWSDENGPADISENIDYYLYDMENVHGE